MKFYRSLIMLFAVCMLYGCGTLRTLDPKANEVQIDTSRCKSISHTYSGVQYNFCQFHARKPKSIVPSPCFISYNGYLTPVCFADTIFSFVADTVVLPYKIYQQSQWGSIRVKN